MQTGDPDNPTLQQSPQRTFVIVTAYYLPYGLHAVYVLIYERRGLKVFRDKSKNSSIGSSDKSK